MYKNKPTIFIFMFLFYFLAFAGKDIAHYISIPIIEGVGIYASVKSLTDDNSGSVTQAASIANLSLIGTNGILGMVTLFSSEDSRPKLRTAHRIIGIAVSGAALWLSISANVDDIDKTTRYVTYGYTGLTLIPVIMFSF